MLVGLELQAVGLGWVASIAGEGMGYAELGIAMTVAGIGTSLCFPTVANAVLGAVPHREAGVASGTNSALRELGGVFGVAILAAVFTHHGVYASALVLPEPRARALDRRRVLRHRRRGRGARRIAARRSCE